MHGCRTRADCGSDFRQCWDVAQTACSLHCLQKMTIAYMWIEIDNRGKVRKRDMVANGSGGGEGKEYACTTDSCHSGASGSAGRWCMLCSN